MVQLAHQYMATGKTIALTIQTFVSKVTALLFKKSYDHIGNIFKSRDITLLTKVCIVKAMVFPVVMYGCELHHKED